MSSSTSRLPFEYNEDLWFDDGDIRVCARRFDSGALCLYKLYRDMLAGHSSVLLGLLDKSLSSPRVYVGDTPYAYLPDDDALDLERFFVAIYYPTYFLFWKHDARSFRGALPVLRIALKYGANDVVEALAAQLEQDWPKTIWEWDASECEDVRRPDDGGHAVAEPASAIHVARMANMPSLFPASYYQLSRISAADDVWGMDAGSSHDRSKGDVEGRSGAMRALLSRDDLLCLAKGKVRLSKHMNRFQRRLAKELVLHPRCAEAWNVGVPMKSEDVLADLLEVCSPKKFPGMHMCSECRAKVNERGREERTNVWELLPKFFCLSLG